MACQKTYLNFFFHRHMIQVAQYHLTTKREWIVALLVCVLTTNISSKCYQKSLNKLTELLFILDTKMIEMTCYFLFLPNH